MKLIFLDIDGVLVRPQDKLSSKHEGIAFNDYCIDVLKGIITTYNTKIVMTSSWRIGKSIAELNDLLGYYNINSIVIDKLDDSVDYFSRETAIKNYVETKKIEKFIILDDMPFDELDSHLIQTQLRIGLSGINSDDFIKIKTNLT